MRTTEVTSDTDESAGLAIAVHNLHVSYPARRRQPAIDALRGVDLTIPSGQAVAMLGPNGSGKSTLMHIICGLLQPAPGRGRIEVHGSSSLVDIRRAIGVVFQHIALDPHQTVREALRDQAALYCIPRAEAEQCIEADLDHSKLLDRREQLIGTLSLGLARRVDLIRAMLHRPRVLLLDEPTVGLDPTAREAFLCMIEERRAEHSLTVLLSTHLIDEADRQDRVILLHKGRIVADDTPAELRQQLGSLMVTVHDARWRPPEEDRGLWRAQSGMWTRPLPGETDAVVELAGDLARQAVPHTIAPPTLADVFEHLTGHQLEGAARGENTHEETAA